MEGCGPPNKKKHTFCVHASSSHLLRGPKTQEGTERRRRRTKQAPRPSSSLRLRFPRPGGLREEDAEGKPPTSHSPLIPPGPGGATPVEGRGRKGPPQPKNHVGCFVILLPPPPLPQGPRGREGGEMGGEGGGPLPFSPPPPPWHPDAGGSREERRRTEYFNMWRLPQKESMCISPT